MKNVEERISELAKSPTEASALREFIKFYSEFVTDEGEILCIHPADEEYLREQDFLAYWNPDDEKVRKDPKKYWDNLIKRNPEIKTKIFGNITPAPFCGNIMEAKVVCIYANPGMGFSTYSDEVENEDLYGELRSLLKNGRTTSNEYGFWPLDQRFENSGGGKWWCRRHKQLFGLIEYLAKNVWEISFDEARKKLSCLFSNIELFPYHSKNVNWRISRNLKAYTINKNLIEQYLYPKAVRNEIVLIKVWGQGEVLVGDKFPEKGSYHIAPKYKGGNHVAERLSPIKKAKTKEESIQNGLWIVDFLSR